MLTWKLKGCPRCRGDIYIDREANSWREQCLQCGYLRDLPGKVKAYQHSGDEEKKKLFRLQSQYS
ncbi:hypothetical protein ACFLXU_02595 [Chloroflexota bacterium]